MMSNIDRFMVRVRAQEDWRGEAMAFASSSYGTMDDEGCKDESKNREDCFQGKEAEFVVWNWLSNFGMEISPPDLNVYSKGAKNHDPDLVSKSGERFHVKSCDDRKETKAMRKSFPVSWMFQVSDHEYGEKDFSVFVRRLDDAIYLIEYVAKKRFLRDADLFKDPIARKYQGIKRAVYRKDLEATYYAEE